MGDSDEKSNTSEIPEWQRDQAATAAPEENKLDIARRFLEDDEVKNASRERKVEFLKSKYIQDQEIEQLLGESGPQTSEDSRDSEEQSSQSAQATVARDTPSSKPHTDNPPVITYPEFLTKPSRPPPLVTANGILGTLYAFAGVSTLIYGTSKYVVEPMVEALTEARHEFQDTAVHSLSKLIEKLESTVSELPAKKIDQQSDDASDIEDPTELFHRDIGTQTSIWVSPALKTEDRSSEPASTQQAKQLSDLVASMNSIKDSFISQSEELADVKTVVDVFKDDLDQLTFPPPQDFVGSYSLYGNSRKNEPDDEIKKAKDNIRRVKGVLLSTRNFPASTR